METERSLDWYKEKISLPDFLLQHGFVDADRTAERSRRMFNPKSGELYILYKKDNKFLYWDPLQSSFVSDKGIKHKTYSIIDFVQSRKEYKEKIPFGKSFNLGYVRGILDKYCNSPQFVASENSSFRMRDVSSNFTSDQLAFNILNNLSPLNDTGYLNRRCICNDVAKNDIFKNTVFNSIFTLPELNKSFTNTAFVLGNEVTSRGGVALKNDSEGGMNKCYFPRADKLCFSSHKTVDKIKELVVCEAFEDCLAHFQINHSGKDNPLVKYLSTQGALTFEQTALISKVIYKIKPDSLAIGFDNDPAGYRYKIALLSEISVGQLVENSLIKDFSNKSEIKCFGAFDKDENLSRYDFFIPVKNNDQAILATRNIELRTSEFNKTNFGVLCEDLPIDFKINNLIDNPNVVCVSLSFNNDLIECHDFVLREMIEMKFNNDNFFSMKSSYLKDYNDDLKAIVGLHDNYKLELSPKNNYVVKCLDEKEKSMLPTVKEKLKMLDYKMKNTKGASVYDSHDSLKKAVEGIKQELSRNNDLII